MSSYFANSYIPDLRNGGVEHPHQHQQHYGAAVQVPQQTQSVQQQSQQAGDPCDPSLLRQGVPGHHYGAAGSQQDMPYPRFPPYNRMDMRNATYYQHQQDHGSGMDGMGGYRSASPSPGMGHMGHTPTPNGHPSTPIVYASCKLQAAAVDHQGSVLDGPDSPPLVESQMHHQMHTQHPHMQPQQGQHQSQAQQQHLQAQQQHMMYQQQQQSQAASQQSQPGMHPQQQQQAQQHQGVVTSPLSQQQQAAPQGAASANLPSPLYPWMRSQFGKNWNFRSLENLIRLIIMLGVDWIVVFSNSRLLSRC